MKKTSNKGFTLVELIIVIAILAIIMLIAMPAVATIIQRNRVKTDTASAQKVAELVRAWYSDFSTDPAKKDLLVKEGNSVVPFYDATAKSVTPVEYSTLPGIDTYIDKGYEPTGLLDENGVQVIDQCFAVFFVGGDVGTSKIAVAIVENDKTNGISALSFEDATEIVVAYDGDPNPADVDDDATEDIDETEANIAEYIAYIE